MIRMNITAHPLGDITKLIDKDFLEHRDVDLYNLHTPNIEKLCEVNIDKLENKYGNDGYVVLSRIFGQPIYLQDIYRLFILAHSNGLKTYCCTLDNNNQADWGVGYCIYRKDKQQDFVLKQTKTRPKIIWSYDKCKKAYLLFKEIIW